jgi:peptidoglycan hydrolase-like protein with peptidoglycan-binding domain
MSKKAIFIQLGMAIFVVPLLSLAATVGNNAVSISPVTVTGIATCFPFSRSLSVGVSGSDVTALQEYLGRQGYFTVSSTGYFGVLTNAAVGKWQAQNNIAALGIAGNGIFGPLSRAYFTRSCGGSTGTGTSTIQQLNAPGSVTLSPGGITEIRNESAYFTLESIASSSATIWITPVGCWNSFPSDPTPKMRCMLALVPIPPQTLMIGQAYTGNNYSITLTQLGDNATTFSVTVK